MSSIVKAEDFARVRAGAVPLDLTDFEQLGEEIVARARARAQELLAEARAEAAKLRRDEAARGREEGHRAGYEEGKDKGLAEGLRLAQQRYAEEQKQLTRALTGALGEFERQRHVLLAAAEHDVLELATAIARRVTRRIAAGEETIAVEQLRAVLERVGARNALAVRVHPEEAEAVRRFAGEMAREIEQWKHVRIEAEEAVGRGGVVVELAQGEVDATMETQLDRIAEALGASVRKEG